jgi:hypothetical protein
MSMVFSVAATSRQIFIVKLFVVCCRFFFYHEALSTIPALQIKAFGLRPTDDSLRIFDSMSADAKPLSLRTDFSS